MDKSIFGFGILALISFNALAQEPLKFPKHLVCKAQGDCIAGYQNFCDANIYFPEPVLIDQPENYAADPFDPSGILDADKMKDKVKLDFSEGDQYSFYFFDRNEMTALAEGRAFKISGTYEDGFDWVNGYNTRAKFNIECTTGVQD